MVYKLDLNLPCPVFLFISDFQHVQLVIPKKFIESVFSGSFAVSQLWGTGSGDGKYVVGLLNLSRLYGNMRASNFTDDKINTITSWSKIPIAGSPLQM